MIPLVALVIGGGPSHGDLALEFKAHFLSVAEHRLIPARAREVTTQFRAAGMGCRVPDSVCGHHAGVEVVSLHGAL